MAIPDKVKTGLFYAAIGVFAAASVLFVVYAHLRGGGPADDYVSDSAPRPIYVIPIGDVAERDAAFARDVLEASFGRETVPGDGLPMQDEYYYPERDQYGALSLLKYLEANAPDDAYRVVGLTNVDIFMEGRNYVIGVARCPGRCAVVSAYRMGAGRVSDERRLARLGKLLMHETGHTYGLHHCRQPLCAMDYAESVASLDGQRFAYCERCEKMICATGDVPASERREKLAEVVEKYGLVDEVGGDEGLAPPPAPENLEWYELEY
jgi:archaemetzincin